MLLQLPLLLVLTPIKLHAKSCWFISVAYVKIPTESVVTAAAAAAAAAFAAAAAAAAATTTTTTDNSNLRNKALSHKRLRRITNIYNI